MAGHTSEKRWRDNQNQLFGNVGVSEQASGIVRNVISTLTEAEAAFTEMQEIYAFSGGTVQGLANQLFKEDWEARNVDGVQAVITVDVVANEVGNPVVTTAGTGYPDGTGYQLKLSATAGGGDGTAVLVYDVVAGAVTNISVLGAGLGYVDGLGQIVQDTPAAGAIYDTEANTEELGKAQDLFDAITAVHELHQCASGIAVLVEDRYAQLRRMS